MDDLPTDIGPMKTTLVVSYFCPAFVGVTPAAFAGAAVIHISVVVLGENWWRKKERREIQIKFQVISHYLWKYQFVTFIISIIMV